ncbi:MAG TPA: DDE-type integrase/transposase/recombinase [Prosthecobacter sp.]|nr:DDE-type integrase/transposase/recombinase [Prosthecobacter sp.]
MKHKQQCLAVPVAWSIRAQDVLRVVEAAIAKHGTREHVRSDNGPEFVAYAIQDWMAQNRIKTLYIKPGSPCETQGAAD